MNTNTASALPMDVAAREIVEHFQKLGFLGVSEAVVLNFRLKAGDREEIEERFEKAANTNSAPPLSEYFEARLAGHYSEGRTLEEIRKTLSSDFTKNLRSEIPKIFFSRSPVFVDDPIAVGTKYDVMLKIDENDGNYAFIILLNDPDATFLDYLTKGGDWGEIMENLHKAANAFGLLGIEAAALD